MIKRLGETQAAYVGYYVESVPVHTLPWLNSRAVTGWRTGRSRAQLLHKGATTTVRKTHRKHKKTRSRILTGKHREAAGSRRSGPRTLDLKEDSD